MSKESVPLCPECDAIIDVDTLDTVVAHPKPGTLSPCHFSGYRCDKPSASHIRAFHARNPDALDKGQGAVSLDQYPDSTRFSVHAYRG